MIIIVTLNPAIDTVIDAPSMHGRDCKARSVTYTLGGKGVNVAKALDRASVSYRSMLLAGKLPFIEDLGSSHELFKLPGTTRQNFSFYEGGKLVAHIRTESTTTLGETEPLTQKLRDEVNPWDIVVISGSLPQILDDETYSVLIQRLNQSRGRLLIDSSSFSMRQLQKLGPHTLKVNNRELRQIVEAAGTENSDYTMAEMVQDALRCRVIVTRGLDDVIAVSETGELSTHGIERSPPDAEASAIGSGDAFMAGYAASLAQGLDFSDCVTEAKLFAAAWQ